MNAVILDEFDLLIAASLLLINGVASIVLHLGLTRSLLVAAARMVVQLYLVGLVLKALFAIASPLLTVAVALSMVLFAGREIMARQERRLIGLWSYGLGTGAMMTAAALVTIFGLTTALSPDPWYDPRYAIPLLGMILGNGMTGISLGVHTLTTTAYRERQAIEAQLTLGADRRLALAPTIRTALRSAMMPTINSMAATGLVFLPGMMTGQILAGVEPEQAVKYQLLVMFLIGGGTAVGAIMAVLGTAYRITDNRHRLRLDRLAAPR